MQLTVERTEIEGGWSRLSVAGEIDIATAPALDDAVDATLAEGVSRLAIDLGAVSFMDSTGLRSLITARRRLDESGGVLAVVSGEGPVRRLLEVAGVTEALNVIAGVGELPEA